MTYIKDLIQIPDHVGCFGVIHLEDRNLPAIAEKRILLPKSEAAKVKMDAEFDRT